MVVLNAAEVSKHSNAKDCWVILHGKVYNATNYLDDHPGGAEIIIDLAGKDCTEEFEDTGHSEEATQQLKTLYVGDLNKDIKDPSNSADTPVAGATYQSKPNLAQAASPAIGTESGPNYILYAGAAVGLAAIAYFVMNRK